MAPRIELPHLCQGLPDLSAQSLIQRDPLTAACLPIEQAALRNSAQELFLQAGNVVIYLDYSGTQELTGRPDLLTELAAWRPSAS